MSLGELTEGRGGDGVGVEPNLYLHRIAILGVMKAYPTLQRRCTENSKQIFPKMKLLGLVANSYIHVSVSYCI
jgi:hypothetical protein